MIPSELNFTGLGVDQLILNNAKLFTLRERLKGFTRNSEVAGMHKESAASTQVTKIPIRILSELAQQIGNIHPGLLLLDGYLNVGQAIDDLREIYVRTQWTESTTAAGILFVTQQLVQSMGERDIAMLSLGGNQAEAITSLRFETVVFPAYYFWLVGFHNVPEERYPLELQSRGIISEDRVKTALEHLEQHKKSRKKGDKKFHKWHFILTG